MCLYHNDTASGSAHSSESSTLCCTLSTKNTNKKSIYHRICSEKKNCIIAPKGFSSFASVVYKVVYDNNTVQYVYIVVCVGGSVACFTFRGFVFRYSVVVLCTVVNL